MSDKGSWPKPKPQDPSREHVQRVFSGIAVRCVAGCRYCAAMVARLAQQRDIQSRS